MSNNLWTMIYSHRHGTSVHHFRQDERPTVKEMIAFINSFTEWEGEGSEADRDDETLSMDSPPIKIDEIRSITEETAFSCGTG